MRVDLGRPLRFQEDGEPVKFVHEGCGKERYLFVKCPGTDVETCTWLSEDGIDELLENAPYKNTYYAAVMRDVAEGEVWVSTTKLSEEAAMAHGLELQEDGSDFKFLRAISFDVEI